MKALVGAALTLGLVAFAIFAGVAINEANYVADHPNAYGPAKVIAWAGGGGALLSVAIALLAAAHLRRR